MTNKHSNILVASSLFIACLQAALITFYISGASTEPHRLSEQDIGAISAAVQSQMTKNSNFEASNSNLAQLESEPYLHKEDLANLIRAVITEELAVHQASFDNSRIKNERTFEQQPEPLTAEEISQQQNAITKSDEIINYAISSGTWSSSDASALTQYIDSLPDQSRDELRERFYTAVNLQQVTIEDYQFPSF